MLNRKVFFREIRGSLFRGRFSKKQVQGITRLLDVWEQHYASDYPDEFLAAGLGTTKHETADTMQPIKEYGGRAYFMRMYDISGNRPAKARELGNIHVGDGAKFPGEGDVQNTGRRNARVSSKLINDLLGTNIDFEKNPELRGHPIYSAHCLYLGCITGLWTGKSWGKYIGEGKGSHANFKQSRRVVNGMDKASLIAGYCVEFLEAIKVARAEAPAPTPEDVPRPPETSDKAPEQSTTLWSVIGGFLSSIGSAFAAVIGLGESQPILAGAIITMTFLTGLFLVWIFRERLKKMTEEGV